MHRRIVRPFGSSIPATRGFSLLLMLVVLGMLYNTVRQPAMWRFLAARDDEAVRLQVAPAAVPAEAPAEEVVVAGPNDLDPDALAEFRRYAELITDRTELRPREMIPYWQLMGWSRTQPFREFEQRASREPVFTQLWEQPEKYRGQPIRLRMHVRRVLKYDAPENPLGIKETYEAWGRTDQSQSFPYVVVLPEKPAGLPVGPEVEADIEFVGYLLKIMSYSDALDTRRGAPLLVGRARLISRPPATKAVAANPWEIWGLVILGAVLLSVASVWFIVSGRRQKRVAASLPVDISSFDLTPSEATSQPLVTDFDPDRNPFR